MPRGTLFLVVGPSGAGKDTLIEAACRQRPDLYRAPRIITRPPDGDNHISATVEEFSAAKRANEFALAWDAHGFRYGVRRDILDRLEAGTSVILNGSRDSVDEARSMYDQIRIIHVTARVDELARRLASRAREDDDAIETRLGRAKRAAPHGPDVTMVDNSGSIDEGTAQFLAALT